LRYRLSVDNILKEEFTKGDQESGMIQKRPGTFVMVDGIAGSGKTTILNALKEKLVKEGRVVFDLGDHESDETPHFQTYQDADVFLTYEPTRTWIGRAIRYELSRTDYPYGGEELAHAFALDRQILYKRFIIPALQANKIVIQSRGISTSLVYQPIMENSVHLETVKNLPGNNLALQHVPDILILANLPAEIAVKRIAERDDDSKGVFAKLDFLRKLEQRFKEPWFHELFEDKGCTIHHIDTNNSLESTIKQSHKLFESIL